jgi:hypothetical protein
MKKMQVNTERLDRLAAQAEREQAVQHGVLPFPAWIWPWVIVASLVRLGAAFLSYFAVALVVAGIVAVTRPGRWLLWAMLFVTAGLVLDVARRFLVKEKRNSAWRSEVTKELYSWRLPPPNYYSAMRRWREPFFSTTLATLGLGHLRGFVWLRTPLHRWFVALFGVRHRHSVGADERLRWARRWAAVEELGALVAQCAHIVGTTVLTAVVAAATGFVHGTPTGRAAELQRLLTDNNAPDEVFRFAPEVSYAVASAAQIAVDFWWQLVMMIPGSGFIAAAGLPTPSAYSGEPTYGVALQLLQLLVLLPLISYATFVLTDREMPPPELLPYGGPVEYTVARELGRRGDRAKGRRLRRALRRAAAGLQQQGVAAPRGTAWDVATVLSVLVGEQHMIRDDRAVREPIAGASAAP